MCREGTAKSALGSWRKVYIAETSEKRSPSILRMRSLQNSQGDTDEKDRDCHRRASLAADARGAVFRDGAGRCHCQDEFEGGRRGAGFHIAGEQLEAGEAEWFPRQEKRHPGVLRARVYRWLNQGTAGLSG